MQTNFCNFNKLTSFTSTNSIDFKEICNSYNERLKTLISVVARAAIQPFLLLAAILAQIFGTGAQAQNASLQTERLCILYDAGETGALIPLLKKWEKENKDFRVLVLATAETIVKPDMFPKKRLVLRDLEIQDHFDSQTPRITPLSLEALQKLKILNPRTVLAGMASQVQQQVLELFSDASTIAFADNFNYDPTHESFATVKKVHDVAKHILCPSQNVVDILLQEQRDASNLNKHSYHVVGKPNLEAWKEEIANVDKQKAIQAAGIEPIGGPVVTFIGGYGPGYDVVNPLFLECSEKLQKEGYRVIIQPHPRMAPQKIKTTEALAISDFVVGYNSSVILDTALCDINALFMIPEEVPFDHFAIRQNLLAKATNCEELLDYIHSGKKPTDIRQALNVPQNSIETISNLIGDISKLNL